MTDQITSAGGFGAPPPEQKQQPVRPRPAPSQPAPSQTTAPALPRDVPGVFGIINEARASGATFNAPIQPNRYSFWEDPKRVARYRNMLRSAPPDFETPAWIDRNQIEQAYQYMKFRNGDKPWTEWQFLADDDPGTSFLRGMPEPPEQFKPAYEQDWTKVNPPPAPEPPPNWADLDLWQQITLGILSPGDPTAPLEGRPDWTRGTASAGQGILAGLGAAAIGTVASGGNPIVGALTGLAAGGATAYQLYTGNEVPIIGDALILFDILSMGADRAIGMIGQVGDDGLATVMADLPAAWKASQLNHLVSPIDTLNLAAWIAGDTTAGSDQVWQLERGLSEPQKLEGGKGTEALREARERIAAGEPEEQVIAEIAARFGTSGTINSLVYGSLLDPAPFLPNVGGRGAARLADMAGNKRLAAAFRAGVGDVAGDLISNLGPIGWAANRLLGLRESDGLIKSAELYRNWVRTAYFPGDTTRTPASQLSSFEKWAGGLDEQGRIKELLPRERKGLISYLNNLTPEAQAHAFMSMAHDNLNVILSLADSDPRQMVKLLRQAAQVDPVEVARVGHAILESPVTVTVAQSLRDVLADNWDQELLLRWEESSQQRGMLEKAAQALGDTAGAILDQYRDNPAALMKRIEAAGGPAGDPTMLRAVFDVFTGEDAAPWNANQFQAELATVLFDKMDAAVATRYKLAPDAPVFRLSQTLKGMQSLLLLGFNPSYFINNQVNNMVTRAATGVFGYMTPRQIKDFTKRFGLTPHRMSDALDAAGEQPGHNTIGRAMRADDWIEKVHGVVTATNKKLGVFSRFSSAGERLESSNAYAIGMQKFFGRAWKRGKGLRQMHPALEAALDRAAPGVKELIYQAIESGMNMQEIEGAVFGQTLRPQVGAILDQAARQLFPDDPSKGVELLRATGIQAKLERELARATSPDQARLAFQRVEDDLRAIVNENMKREISTRAEDTSNRVKAEGTPAVLAELTGIIDRVTRRAGANADSFARVYGYTEQTLAGILRAVGRGNEQAKAISRAVTRAARELKKFDTARKKLTTSLAKTRDTAEQARLRTQIKQLHDDYSAVLQEAAADIQRATGAQEAPPTPAAQPQTPVMQALYQLATEHQLTDRDGNPVMRYLMNVINRYRPEGQKYTRPEQIKLDEARQTLELHAARLAAQPDRLALDYNEITSLADSAARQAELEANGMMTRRLMREQLAEKFSASDAEVAAAMTVMDYHADQVARKAGKTPSEATRDAWYATRIATILEAGGDASAYNNYYQQQYGTLVALHNIRADELLASDKLGGLAMPSLAILPASRLHAEFGEISLIARRDTIDPRASRTNKVFDTDAWTPTFPSTSWKKAPGKKVNELLRRFNPIDLEFGEYFTRTLYDYAVNYVDGDKFLDAFYKFAGPRVMFLRERGIEPEIIYKQPYTLHRFLAAKAAQDWFKARRDDLAALSELGGFRLYDDPLYKEFEGIVKASIDEVAPQGWGGRVWESLTREVAGGLISPRILKEIIAEWDEFANVARKVDSSKTIEAAARLIDKNKLGHQYMGWARKIRAEVYGEPVLKHGNRTLPYTLTNIVKIMRGEPIVGSQAEAAPITSIGAARALAAREFKSVAEMHQAEGLFEKPLSPGRIAEALEDWQRALSFAWQEDGLTPYGSDMHDAGLRILARYLKGGTDRDPARMEAAIKAQGLDPANFMADDIEVAINSALSLGDLKIDYFEAKPRRAVMFSEFAGAVVPDNASPEVLEMLQRRGIEYRTYKAGSNFERQRAVESFYQNEGVLFQGSERPKGKRGQVTMPVEELVANARKIRELGFVPHTAVAPVFAGATPAYLREIARFIMERRERYIKGQMTVRDVAKSYLITVSSQGSDALDIDTVLESFSKHGLKLERNGVPMDLTRYTHPEIREKTSGRKNNKKTVQTIHNMIRPEEVAGLWLLSDQGKAALDALERGEVTEAWKNYVQGRKVFGRFGTGRKFEKSKKLGTKVFLEDEGDWLIKKGARKKFNLHEIQQVTDEINAAEGDPALMRKAVMKLASIGEGKAGFLKHMIGFADETTFDTQQANFWRGYLGQEGFDPKLLETLDWGNWGQDGVIDEFKSMVTDAYWKLRQEGIGEDIPEEAFVHIMHHWLWDYQKNKDLPEYNRFESTHAAMYEALELAQQAKGSVNFLKDGRAVINALEAPDVSTMMHEIGHIFRRDLPEADLDVVAQIGGLRDGSELMDLQERFYRGEIMPGDPEYKAYVNAEEYFARAWERYLAEGDAPTPELRGVFEQFTTWLLNIYKELRRRWDDRRGGERTEYFDRQSEFIVDGRVVNVNMNVGGRSLRDIFDELLVEKRIDPDDEGYTPAETTASQAPTSTPEREAILYQPVKKLPDHVRKAMADIATILQRDLAASRVYMRSYTEVEGGAEVTKYRREWEGPQWWRDILDSAEAAGQDTDGLKDRYMGQFKSIISGRDTGKAIIAPEVKALILSRALGDDPNDAIVQPAILRYLGENDTLFQEFGDRILSSDEAALREMFGDDYSAVVDETLLWMSEHQTGDDADLFMDDAQLDIAGQPVNGLAQQAAARQEISSERRRSMLRQQAHAVDPKITADEHIVNIVRRYTKHRPEGIDDVNGQMLTEALAERQHIEDMQPGLFQVAGPQTKTNTPAFKRWFGSSKVLDENGNPLRLYHGTLMDFTEFRPGSPEGFWGNGFYFTNSTEDASWYANTAGPDWNSKIEVRAEKLGDSYDWEWDAETLAPIMGESVETVQEWIDEGSIYEKVTDEHRQAAAMKSLGIENEGNIMPVYVKMEKPLDFTDPQAERLTYEVIEDDEGEFLEERGTFVDFIDQVRSLAIDYGADGDAIANAIWEQVIPEDEPRITQVFETLREIDEIQNIEGEIGDSYGLVGTQFLADLAQRLGYDGVIMDAYKYFGPNRLNRGQGMPGVDKNTRHYIAFTPNQAKSIFNRGTFDPGSPNVLYQGTGEQAQPFNPAGNGVPPGGTPAPEPYGSTLDEVVFEQVQPILRAAEAQYNTSRAQRPVKLGSLDTDTQGQVRDYMKQVAGDLASTKYAAMQYGQQMRDSSLLNYNRRYGADQFMEILFPYQFWYTRSMTEWAKRMIDKPGWFAMYARLQKAQERTEANMPERMKGKMRMPAPWMPEWAGGGLWFDPMAKFMPFSSFGQPMEQYVNNVRRSESSAEYILRGWVENDRITQAEADEAVASKSGPVWDRALKQAEVENDQSANPAGFASLMFSPSLFWTAGKNILAGTPEKISTLPITRTASAVQTATEGTPLEPFGQFAGLAAWPEKAARQAAGLNEFGEWGDWYIDRQIANMAAEGIITAEQAQTAMIERAGNPLFEDARARVRYEQMLQVPGAALTQLLAQGNIEGAIQALPTLIFNGSLLPEGELKLRGLKDEFSRAMTLRDQGDEEAVNKFFTDNPEYAARLALNDPPEERLRQFLISEIWDKYTQLERPNRSLAADQLGPQFRDAFLNKETRAYDAIPVEVLARWTQMLGSAIPQTPETAPVIDNPELPVEVYPPALAAGITTYQEERSQKFPNYYAQQQAYFAIPEGDKAARRRLLQRFPELPKYWDWKRQYETEHPELKDYFDGVVADRARARGEGLSQQEIQNLDPILLRQVVAAEVAGQTLTEGAYQLIAHLAEKKGLSARQYQQMIVNTLLPQ